MSVDHYVDLDYKLKIKFNEVQEQIEFFSAELSSPLGDIPRIRALRMLSGLGPVTVLQKQEIFDLLQTGFTDPSGPVRVQAVRSVCSYSSKFPPFIQPARQVLARVFLDDHNEAVSHEAAKAIRATLCGFSPADSDFSIPALMPVFSPPDFDLFIQTLMPVFSPSRLELSRADPSNHPTDSVLQMAEQAAVLLGFSGTSQAIRPLWANRYYPSVEVQTAIAWALGQLAVTTQDPRPSVYLTFLANEPYHDEKVILTAKIQFETMRILKASQNVLWDQILLRLPVNGQVTGNGILSKSASLKLLVKN